MPTKEIAPGVLAVTELPSISFQHFVRNDQKGNSRLLYYVASQESMPLPPGSWSIVGWSDELTEEQMKGIVEGNNGGENDTMFMDYPSKDKFMCYLHRTETQSFASLLRSHGITDRALIIKKEK